MTTRKQLVETVQRLTRKGAFGGNSVRLEYAYGKPRLEDETQHRYISPRLPAGQMALWLDGFECGYDETERRVAEAARHPAAEPFTKPAASPYTPDQLAALERERL